MQPQTISELISTLRANPYVLGLIEFGNDRHDDHYAVGDYDLFAVLSECFSSVTSLHFYVGHIPVDLNFITRAEFEELTARDHFRWAALRNGRVIYDPEGSIAPVLVRLQANHAARSPDQLSENTVARTRQWHRHILDKVRGRLETDPVVCRFILSTNMARLIANYFRVRQHTFDGEIQAMAYLQLHEPELFAKITALYTTDDLNEQVELTREISSYVLAPIGGLWQDDEVLAFGTETSSDLQVRAYELFRSLFSGLQQ